MKPRGTNVEEAVLFIGPNEVPRPGTALLQYHETGEKDWQARTLRGDEFLGDLTALDNVLGTQLVAINGLTPAQFHAVHRSLRHVSEKSRTAVQRIVFISVEDVLWPNTALGFPRPGMMYAQVITPGHKVVLRLPNGAEVECHTSAAIVASTVD